MMKTAEINHLLPHFKLLKSEIANLVNLVSHGNNKQRTCTFSRNKHSSFAAIKLICLISTPVDIYIFAWHV